MSAAVPDIAARREALDPTRSFAVSAPAGSGKTGLLTQRVLRLLAGCDYPEEVLAITFTRKAAQEMHHRIATALQKAREGAPASSDHERLTMELADQVLARDSRLGWQLLRSPSRLRIQTIDSFCQSITRQLPVAAGASAYLETRENASGLYRAAVQELFRQMREEGPLAQAVGTLLRHMDTNLPKVENLLVQLLQQRSQWLGPLFYSQGNQHYFEASIQAIVVNTLEQARQKLRPHLRELEELLRFSSENRLRAGAVLAFGPADIQLESDEAEHALSLWQALVDLCLTSAGTWRKTINNKSGFPAPSSTKDALEKALFSQMKERLMALLQDMARDPELPALLADIRCLPNLAVDPEQWRLLESLTLVLPSLAALFNLHCRKVGEADFTEVAIAASRALGEEDEPSDIALKLDYRIKHILVDEFQDTSRPQLELLRKLTAGWEPGDGRTLFIVGDAMQSCYGFRDANVGIFIQARDRGIGNLALTPLNLTVNFRSDAKVVDWVNRCFRHIFPARDDINRGAVCYSTADHCGGPEQGIIEARGFVDTGEEAQARYLRELLRDELASGSGSIAILARSRSHLQDVLRELRLANISWQARDIDALGDRMAVIDLLSLTRALLDLSDRIAWLSILRAPWCGIDLHDLHTLANRELATHPLRAKGVPPLIWNQILHCEELGLSQEGFILVQRLREVLQAAFDQKERKPLRQWLEGTWLALGGPAAVANPAESHSPRHYFNLLEQHSRGGDVEDWEEFENALASLYDKSDQRSRLQVMTIHKSKGLEFDTVIIPKLNKGTRGDDNPLLLWQEYLDNEGRGHLLISPQSAVGGRADSLYAYLKRERSLRQDYETARLLYVACTRAISKLYLLIDLERDEKSRAIKPPGKNTLAAHLWPIINDEIVLVENAVPATRSENSSPAYVQSHILRLPQTWQAPAWPRDDTLATFRGRASFGDDESPDRTPLLARAARYTGTVLHRALRSVCLDGVQVWDDRRLEAQRPLWIQQLRQLGANAGQAELGAAQVAEALKSALADPVGRWLLDNSHEESACELPVLGSAAGYREAVIDRSFVDRGCRWIVDYKSIGELHNNLGTEELLQQAQEEYSPQLRRYRDLMRKLDQMSGRERPIRTALYFPQLQRLHEIEFAES